MCSNHVNELLQSYEPVFTICKIFEAVVFDNLEPITLQKPQFV